MQKMTTLLITLFFLLPTRSFSVTGSDKCVVLYDPSYYTNLIAKENLGALARVDGEWFEVLVPQSTAKGVTLEYKKLREWSEVVTAFSDVTAAERFVAQNKMIQYVEKVTTITRFFKNLARRKNASMSMRLKELESLRDKIIEKIKSGRAGNFFEFDSIDDFLGFRFLVNRSSELLEPSQIKLDLPQDQLASFYAEKLGIRTEDILDVGIKGNDAYEKRMKKFYRAVHLAVLVEGVPVELQIMTRSMAQWHFWDHPRVYKAKSTDKAYVAQLKYYSEFWVRFIRTIEDATPDQNGRGDINEFLGNYGLRITKEFDMHNLESSLENIDAYMAEKLGVQENDRFLGNKSVITRAKKNQLFKDLNVPQLF